ncbi:hypothetical protein [Nocardia asteroides]|uniref:hypothetical protein n=1 Tax=Nocardia asteroides TaxID=1824 RepID=UPI00364D906E
MDTYCAIPSCLATDLDLHDKVTLCNHHAWVVYYWQLAHDLAHAPVSLVKPRRVPEELWIDPLDFVPTEP